MERADLEQWRPRDVARLLALVEAQRRYFQEIVASLPVGVLVLSANLEIVLANAAVRKIFNLSNQGPVRLNLSTVLPQWVLGRVEQVVKTRSSETNLLVDAGSGHRLQVGIVTIPGWDEEGGTEVLLTVEDVEGVAVTAPEATAFRGAQVPVRSAASGLTPFELVEDLAAVLWAVDPRNMRPIFVSPQAEKLLGFPPEFWINNPSFWTDRVHPADRERVIDFYRQAVKNDQESACEFRSVRADGQVIWLRETVRAVTDAASRPIYLAGITVDVTDRRLMEQQLVQRERIDAIQKLASRMAHDLNNVLMILQGNAEEVLSGLPADSPLRDEAEAIVAATQRINGFTTNLLAFTRRAPTAAEAIELEPVLTAVSQRLGVQRKGALSRGRVKSNAAQLEQVLTAIVAAARKASKSSAVMFEAANVSIREELQRTDPPLKLGTYTTITISGQDGRAEAEFDATPFERLLPEKDALDETSAKLAQAYGMVRQWGGDIATLGAAGEAAVFRLFLECVAGPSEDVGAAVAEPSESRVQRKPATILLVEDEAAIRALVKKFLRKQDYEVLEASNGKEALDIVRGHPGPIDVLVTDMMMPHMGGRELADRLHQQGRDLKILYISGYTDDSTVYAAELPPGNAFLQKPFTLSALLEKVRGLLSF